MPEEPDATAPFDRPTPPDATRINGGTGGRPDSDATRIGEPLAPGQVPGAAGQEPGAAAEAPRWSARANVPQPGDPALRQAAPQEWLEEDPYQGRSWFTPVIVGVVALVLVGALSVGIYLIYRATANGENAPVGEGPSASPSSSVAVPTQTQKPTSAPPSSAAPSTTTAAPAPSGVVIPPLHGNTLAEATIKLQQLGLQVKPVRVVNTSVQPGEVFKASPGEGETVRPGDTVTLYVATAPSPAPSKTSVSPSAKG